jgi:oxygen-independent coproporphyrinogen-3 oxidase
MKKLGLYLHIPFCLQKCNYCDFCSAPASKEVRAAYVRALCAHLRALSPAARDYTVDTVYFGGGTPTLLSAEEFSCILDTVRAHYRILPDAEITAECNPVTGAEALFAGMRKAGINRLSIGLQSIHENELKLLGRLHSFADFENTFLAARRAGFDNISTDLMFGIPAQSVESFRETLNTVCALAPEHVSAYGLRVEDGTPFGRMRDALLLPDEDEEAEMAELVATLLPARGYERYEISNYAKAGYPSRHNLRYWLGEEYLGFGPAAHSFFGGIRFETPADTAAYLAAVQKGDFDALFTAHHKVEGTEARDEHVMLRMRLAEGVDKADFLHRFGTSFESCYGELAPLVQGGFLKNTDTCVAFTARGMQLSNAILSEWLDFGGNE